MFTMQDNKKELYFEIKTLVYSESVRQENVDSIFE